jgi:dynein heavy chain
MTKKPEDGCYIYGFYIEGGSWNSSTKLLDDPIPKILFPQMPKIWFIPKHGKVIKNNV